MKKLWSELPNAKHIDWVLKSMKSNTDIWFQCCDQALDQVLYEAWNQVYDQIVNSTWDQAYIQARDQVWDRDQTWYRHQIFVQVSGILLALIAYDDCEKYLCMTYNELKAWALVSENPQAILLLPLVYVKEQLNECLV